MTTTSLKVNRLSIAFPFVTITASIILLVSCSKNEKLHQTENSKSNKVSKYSSEVLDKWMTLQLRLMRNTTGVPNQAFSRHYVYSGIAALESLAPGLPAHAAWSSRWNGLTSLPAINQSVQYYYPANVNAALAYINKAFFPNATVIDKAAIDSLENALTQEFLGTQSQSVVTVSSNYGKQVATTVFAWSEMDGYKNAGAPYTPPVGPGMWVPTAPAFANAASPYWGNNRTVITGSIVNTEPAAPMAYSAEPGSPFYQMVKQVYDVSQQLTNEQKAMAMFWRDVPGVTSPGHWLSILRQAIVQTNSSLDKGALAYALTGAAINDALIACWKSKYQFSLVRPITYIRDIFGHSSWVSFLTTPAHPEYPSAHAVLSIAAGRIMDELFENIGSFTDRTYDYLGFGARTYSSFNAIGVEAGLSRLYAGIHYQPSIDAGFVQGIKVAENIFKVNPK